MPDGEQRIIVELVSSADVKRLEARDDEVREDVLRLRHEVEALRRQLYDFLERFGDRSKK